MPNSDLRIAVSFALVVPAESLTALAELAAVESDDRAGMRRFVQAEPEQTLIAYLTDNGVQVQPARGVALTPDDYTDTVTRPNSEA